MKKLFSNAKQEPRIFYAKHIAPGVCGYEDETVFLGEDALRKMDKTFAGKPIYVNHQKVNLDNLQEEADGYVVESFYLPEDGSHWTKNIVVSDRGHEAIGKGWAVSNAYIPDEFGASGEWHNVPYDREITDAHYTHLAIVENPRYEEAVIMTPEEFKAYKESKREQLSQLENSKNQKGEKRMTWKLFDKKEKTNSEEISKTMVELSNGSTVSIGEMINAVEEDIKAKEKKDKCNDTLEEVVKVNGEDMKVSDLIKAYEKNCKCNEDEEKDKEKKDSEDKKEEDKKEDKKSSKENEEDKEKEDKKNEDVDKRELIRKIMALAGEAGMSEEKVRTIAKWAEELGYDKDLAQKEGKKNEEDKEKDKKEDKKNSKELLEAEEKANAKKSQGQVVDTMSRKLARGQEHYGSAK